MYPYGASLGRFSQRHRPHRLSERHQARREKLAEKEPQRRRLAFDNVRRKLMVAEVTREQSQRLSLSSSSLLLDAP